MLRIRNKDDLFTVGTSPWRSRNKRRNLQQYSSTRREQNPQIFSQRNGSSILNPWVIGDIEESAASESSPSDDRSEIEVLNDEVGVSVPSLLASPRPIESHERELRLLRSYREKDIDDRSNETVDVTLHIQGGPQAIKVVDSERLGLYVSPTNMRNGEKAAQEGFCRDPGPCPHGERIGIERGSFVYLHQGTEGVTRQDSSEREGTESPQARFNNSFLFNNLNRIRYSPPRTRGASDNLKPHKPLTPSNVQSPSLTTAPTAISHPLCLGTRTRLLSPPQELEMPGRSKYPCIFRGSRPGEALSSFNIPDRPLVRARKRAAEEAGVTLEEYARGNYRPKRIRDEEGQGSTRPLTSKPKKKRKKSQNSNASRKKARKATISKGKTQAGKRPLSDHGQSGGVEGENGNIEPSIAPENQNSISGRRTSPRNKPSSTITNQSRTSPIMPRKQSKKPPPGSQQTKSEAIRQQTAAVSSSSSSAHIAAEESQKQLRCSSSPERPTTISEITDEEIEERKTQVPDRAATQTINRLFFTPRPGRLLTREEMSRFLDPDLLPRFNPALRKPSDPPKPTKK
ncbi:hypothetical protein TWF718_006005 [Orbilia javanica]|uniref:Uncharacterized protein n=1 Tax=Orbilia javanica TaxID=47235 RepID=A0AAN8N8M8_9PEZI